jgi:hypothetical protein
MPNPVHVAAAADVSTTAPRDDILATAAAASSSQCNMSTSTLAALRDKLPNHATFVMGLPGDPGFMSIELTHCSPPSSLCAAANQPYPDGNCIDTSRPIKPGQLHQVAVFSSYADVSTMKCPGAGSLPFRPTPRSSALTEINYIINKFSYGESLHPGDSTAWPMGGHEWPLSGYCLADVAAE